MYKYKYKYSLFAIVFSEYICTYTLIYIFIKRCDSIEDGSECGCWWKVQLCDLVCP